MRCDYDPLTDADRLRAAFGVALPADGAVMAPAGFIVAADPPAPGALGLLRVGRFGLLPAAQRDDGDALRVRECPVETMKSNPVCRESWWAGRRCVVPLARLTGWCHVTGRPQAWGIGRADGDPLALAGLWSESRGAEGEPVAAFCVLTLTAAGHPVFGRLALPMAQQPRMPVVLGGAAQRQWLHGSWAEAERVLLRCPAEWLHAAPLDPSDPAAQRTPPGLGMADLFDGEGWQPAPPRPRREVQRRVARARAPAGPVTGDLFA